MLPESEGIPSLIVELSQTATASGVDLLGISRGTTQPGTPFGIQSVTLQVNGAFFDVEDFLYGMESYVAFSNSQFRAEGRLLDVTQLTLTGGTATTTGVMAPLSVTITLNAYLWGATSTTAATGGAQ